VEADNRSLILFDRGDEVTLQAGNDGIRFLLVSGKPLEEPVAWYGPIVMNTQEQLRRAFTELQEGTFLKDAGRKLNIDYAKDYGANRHSGLRRERKNYFGTAACRTHGRGCHLSR